jgi:hypothetical protein
MSVRLRSSFRVVLGPVTTLTLLCLLTYCRMRRPNVLNLDLTATAMLHPSTFGYPIDVASLIDYNPPLR